MLKLIPRSEEFLSGYKAYCQEFFDHNITTFKPMNPDHVSVKWFRDSFSWYQKKEHGLIKGHSASIHLWAVHDSKFIGEFQLRTELTDEVMNSIGSIGYSVRCSEQGKGYGKQILGKGLEFARSQNLEKVILLIEASNIVSRNLCESFGGEYFDTILLDSDIEGENRVVRYWIHL